MELPAIYNGAGWLGTSAAKQFYRVDGGYILLPTNVYMVMIMVI
jgi:hypothetical protein